jgi:hypothetical protein
MTCTHEKVDDYATCLICRSCNAVGRLTPSLRKQPLRLVWMRVDEMGRPLEILGFEGLENESQ